MSQTPGRVDSGDAPASRTFSLLRVVILVVVGLIVGAGIMLTRQPTEPEQGADAVSPYTPQEELLRTYALPPNVRKPALNRLNELADGRDTGEVAAADYAAVVKALENSQLRHVAGHDVLIRKYIDSPALSDEQRARGKEARGRYLRGLMDEKIHPQTMDNVLEPVRKLHEDDAVSLDPNPPVEKIVELIDRLELHADGADISGGEFEIDYTAELLRVIEDALKRRGNDAAAG